MDERDNERLRAAVGEYLEAVERMDAMRPRLLGLVSVTPKAIEDALLCAASVRRALQGLRETYRGLGQGEAIATAVGFRPPHADLKLSRTWPLGSGQRV